MIHEQAVSTLPRTSSCNSSKNIIPSNYLRSNSTTHENNSFSIVHKNHGANANNINSPAPFHHFTRITRSSVSAIFRSLFKIVVSPVMLPTCMFLNLPPANMSIVPASSLGRRVTGTLFGHRRGHVTFAVQENPVAEPAILIEFAVSTSTLVKEMSSGLVRIALECEKGARVGNRRVRLFEEPRWTMYCNGRKCGHALSRTCTDFDRFVLRTVRSVSVGAGVIPVVDDGRKSSEREGGELLYMRARFERVVGNRDSEAFYMMNIDGTGGPELSIFLLRT